MAQHGGKRENAGRKPKATEQELIERLSPYDDIAIQKLFEAMDNGESWAIKMFMEYRYGKPKETVATTHTFEGIPPIKWADGEDQFET